MQDLIINYLFQNEQCPLPGIGKFKIIHIPALYDDIEMVLIPPMESISFEEGSSTKASHLIELISLRKEISKENAKKLLYEYCNEIKIRLDKNEKVGIETVGKIFKNERGKIDFVQEKYSFVLPVIPVNKIKSLPIERDVNSLNETPTHPKKINFQIFNSTENDIFWKYLVILIALIAITTGLYNFYKNGFNSDSLGNKTHITIGKPVKTHE